MPHTPVHESQTELSRLNRLIGDLGREEGLIRRTTGRNVRERFIGRGIRGPFAGARAREAADLATSGILRRLTGLRESRTDLQQLIKEQKKAEAERKRLEKLLRQNPQLLETAFSPGAIQAPSILPRRRSPASAQPQQGFKPLAVIRNISGRPNRLGRNRAFTVRLAGAGSIPKFNTFEEALDFVKRRGLQGRTAFAGPGELTGQEDLIERINRAGIPIISGQQTGNPLDFIRQFSEVAGSVTGRTQAAQDQLDFEAAERENRLLRRFAAERAAVAGAPARRERALAGGGIRSFNPGIITSLGRGFRV